MSSSYRTELDKWLEGLDVKANRVLDIGGSQLPVKGRTKSWDVKEYLIADLEKPQAQSPQADIDIDMNRSIYRDVEQSVFHKFDLIFCLEVMEYVYDPSQAFYNLNWCLSGGGIAWVSFPSFYPLHQPIEDDALRYMPGGIMKLAKENNLTVKQMIKRRPETDALQRAWSVERMRAAKGEDHAFTGFIVELKNEVN